MYRYHAAAIVAGIAATTIVGKVAAAIVAAAIAIAQYLHTVVGCALYTGNTRALRIHVYYVKASVLSLVGHHDSDILTDLPHPRQSCTYYDQRRLWCAAVGSSMQWCEVVCSGVQQYTVVCSSVQLYAVVCSVQWCAAVRSGI